MKETALVIMAKRPVIGKTKTRLCPFLTPEEAARLYEALLRDTIALVERVNIVADLAVAITPPESQAYFAGITPPGTRLLPVTGSDIGYCLGQALGRLFDLGYKRVLALNSDGPSLPLDYLHQAIQCLNQADLVLGPAQDGGYYLVGMKQLHQEIFQGIAWSTERVLSQTLARAQGLSLSVAQTPPWYDIDTPSDLARLQADLASTAPGSLVHTRAILFNLAINNRTG